MATEARAALISAARDRSGASQVVALTGFGELMSRLEASLGADDIVPRALDSIGLLVSGEAKRRSPVDTGRLRSSITHHVNKESDGWIVRIGTDVNYAPFMEFGTGRLSDSGIPGRGEHRPPAIALDRWARRHGMPNGFVVARTIARRGGLRPRRYLRGAIEERSREIETAFGVIARSIEQRWANG